MPERLNQYLRSLPPGSSTLNTTGAMFDLGQGNVRSQHGLLVVADANATEGVVKLLGSLDALNWYDTGGGGGHDLRSRRLLQRDADGYAGHLPLPHSEDHDRDHGRRDGVRMGARRFPPGPVLWQGLLHGPRQPLIALEQERGGLIARASRA
jgi:hypothetical protein